MVRRPQIMVVCVVVACVVVAGIEWVGMGHQSYMPLAPPVGTHVRFGQLAPPPTAQATDCATQACLAITFDDGPNPVVTPQVLDILARHHAHATFFVIGLHVPGNEGLLRRMYQDGHEVGNHSWSHPDFTTIPSGQISQQITATQAAVVHAGLPAPRLFRPPYGALNAGVRNQIQLTTIGWNIDPEDWRAKKPEEIIDRVKATAKPGGIIDLHDIHQATADALDPILTDLQQRYTLVTVSDLFNLLPGQPGTFYGR